MPRSPGSAVRDSRASLIRFQFVRHNYVPPPPHAVEITGRHGNKKENATPRRQYSYKGNQVCENCIEHCSGYDEDVSKCIPYTKDTQKSPEKIAIDPDEKCNTSHSGKLKRGCYCANLQTKSKEPSQTKSQYSNPADEKSVQISLGRTNSNDVFDTPKPTQQGTCQGSTRAATQNDLNTDSLPDSPKRHILLDSTNYWQRDGNDQYTSDKLHRPGTPVAFQKCKSAFQTKWPAIDHRKQSAASVHPSCCQSTCTSKTTGFKYGLHSIPDKDLKSEKLQSINPEITAHETMRRKRSLIPCYQAPSKKFSTSSGKTPKSNIMARQQAIINKKTGTQMSTFSRFRHTNRKINTQGNVDVYTYIQPKNGSINRHSQSQQMVLNQNQHKTSNGSTSPAPRRSGPPYGAGNAIDSIVSGDRDINVSRPLPVHDHFAVNLISDDQQCQESTGSSPCKRCHETRQPTRATKVGGGSVLTAVSDGQGDLSVCTGKYDNVVPRSLKKDGGPPPNCIKPNEETNEPTCDNDRLPGISTTRLAASIAPGGRTVGSCTDIEAPILSPGTTSGVVCLEDTLDHHCDSADSAGLKLSPPTTADGDDNNQLKGAYSNLPLNGEIHDRPDSGRTYNGNRCEPGYHRIVEDGNVGACQYDGNWRSNSDSVWLLSQGRGTTIQGRYGSEASVKVSHGLKCGVRGIDFVPDEQSRHKEGIREDRENTQDISEGIDEHAELDAAERQDGLGTGSRYCGACGPGQFSNAAIGIRSGICLCRDNTIASLPVYNRGASGINDKDKQWIRATDNAAGRIPERVEELTGDTNRGNAGRNIEGVISSIKCVSTAPVDKCSEESSNTINSANATRGGSGASEGVSERYNKHTSLPRSDTAVLKRCIFIPEQRQEYCKDRATDKRENDSCCCETDCDYQRAVRTEQGGLSPGVIGTNLPGKLRNHGKEPGLSCCTGIQSECESETRSGNATITSGAAADTDVLLSRRKQNKHACEKCTNRLLNRNTENSHGLNREDNNLEYPISKDESEEARESDSVKLLSHVGRATETDSGLPNESHQGEVKWCQSKRNGDEVSTHYAKDRTEHLMFASPTNRHPTKVNHEKSKAGSGQRKPTKTCQNEEKTKKIHVTQNKNQGNSSAGTKNRGNGTTSSTGRNRKSEDSKGGVNPRAAVGPDLTEDRSNNAGTTQKHSGSPRGLPDIEKRSIGRDKGLSISGRPVFANNRNNKYHPMSRTTRDRIKSAGGAPNDDSNGRCAISSVRDVRKSESMRSSKVKDARLKAKTISSQSKSKTREITSTSRRKVKNNAVNLLQKVSTRAADSGDEHTCRNNGSVPLLNHSDCGISKHDADSKCTTSVGCTATVDTSRLDARKTNYVHNSGFRSSTADEVIGFSNGAQGTVPHVKRDELSSGDIQVKVCSCTDCRDAESTGGRLKEQRGNPLHQSSKAWLNTCDQSNIKVCSLIEEIKSSGVSSDISRSSPACSNLPGLNKPDADSDLIGIPDEIASVGESQSTEEISQVKDVGKNTTDSSTDGCNQSDLTERLPWSLGNLSNASAKALCPCHGSILTGQFHPALEGQADECRQCNDCCCCDVDVSGREPDTTCVVDGGVGHIPDHSGNEYRDNEHHRAVYQRAVNTEYDVNSLADCSENYGLGLNEAHVAGNKQTFREAETERVDKTESEIVLEDGKFLDEAEQDRRDTSPRALTQPSEISARTIPSHQEAPSQIGGREESESLKCTGLDNGVSGAYLDTSSAAVTDRIEPTKRNETGERLSDCSKRHSKNVEKSVKVVHNRIKRERKAKPDIKTCAVQVVLTKSSGGRIMSSRTERGTSGAGNGSVSGRILKAPKVADTSRHLAGRKVSNLSQMKIPMLEKVSDEKKCSDGSVKSDSDLKSQKIPSKARKEMQNDMKASTVARKSVPVLKKQNSASKQETKRSLSAMQKSSRSATPESVLSSSTSSESETGQRAKHSLSVTSLQKPKAISKAGQSSSRKNVPVNESKSIPKPSVIAVAVSSAKPPRADGSSKVLKERNIPKPGFNTKALPSSKVAINKGDSSKTKSSVTTIRNKSTSPLVPRKSDMSSSDKSRSRSGTPVSTSSVASSEDQTTDSRTKTVSKIEKASSNSSSSDTASKRLATSNKIKQSHLPNHPVSVKGTNAINRADTAADSTVISRCVERGAMENKRSLALAPTTQPASAAQEKASEPGLIKPACNDSEQPPVKMNSGTSKRQLSTYLRREEKGVTPKLENTTNSEVPDKTSSLQSLKQLGTKKRTAEIDSNQALFNGSVKQGGLIQKDNKEESKVQSLNKSNLQKPKTSAEKTEAKLRIGTKAQSVTDRLANKIPKKPSIPEMKPAKKSRLRPLENHSISKSISSQETKLKFAPMKDTRDHVTASSDRQTNFPNTGMKTDCVEPRVNNRNRGSVVAQKTDTSKTSPGSEGRLQRCYYIPDSKQTSGETRVIEIGETPPPLHNAAAGLSHNKGSLADEQTCTATNKHAGRMVVNDRSEVGLGFKVTQSGVDSLNSMETDSDSLLAVSKEGREVQSNAEAGASCDHAYDLEGKSDDSESSIEGSNTVIHSAISMETNSEIHRRSHEQHGTNGILRETDSVVDKELENCSDSEHLKTLEIDDVVEQSFTRCEDSSHSSVFEYSCQSSDKSATHSKTVPTAIGSNGVNPRKSETDTRKHASATLDRKTDTLSLRNTPAGEFYLSNQEQSKTQLHTEHLQDSHFHSSCAGHGRPTNVTSLENVSQCRLTSDRETGEDSIEKDVSERLDETGTIRPSTGGILWRQEASHDMDVGPGGFDSGKIANRMKETVGVKDESNKSSESMGLFEGETSFANSSASETSGGGENAMSGIDSTGDISQRYFRSAGSTSETSLEGDFSGEPASDCFQTTHEGERSISAGRAKPINEWHEVAKVSITMEECTDRDSPEKNQKDCETDSKSTESTKTYCKAIETGAVGNKGDSGVQPDPHKGKLDEVCSRAEISKPDLHREAGAGVDLDTSGDFVCRMSPAENIVHSEDGQLEQCENSYSNSDVKMDTGGECEEDSNCPETTSLATGALPDSVMSNVDGSGSTDSKCSSECRFRTQLLLHEVVGSANEGNTIALTDGTDNHDQLYVEKCSLTNCVLNEESMVKHPENSSSTLDSDILLSPTKVQDIALEGLECTDKEGMKCSQVSKTRCSHIDQDEQVNKVNSAECQNDLLAYGPAQVEENSHSTTAMTATDDDNVLDNGFPGYHKEPSTVSESNVVNATTDFQLENKMLHMDQSQSVTSESDINSLAPKETGSPCLSAYTSDDSSVAQPDGLQNCGNLTRALQPDASSAQTSCGEAYSRKLYEISEPDKHTCRDANMPKYSGEAAESHNPDDRYEADHAGNGDGSSSLSQCFMSEGEATCGRTCIENRPIAEDLNRQQTSRYQMAGLSHVNIIHRKTSHNDGVSKNVNQPDQCTGNGKDCLSGNLLTPDRELRVAGIVFPGEKTELKVQEFDTGRTSNFDAAGDQFVERPCEWGNCDTEVNGFIQNSGVPDSTSNFGIGLVRVSQVNADIKEEHDRRKELTSTATVLPRLDLQTRCQPSEETTYEPPSSETNDSEISISDASTGRDYVRAIGATETGLIVSEEICFDYFTGTPETDENISGILTEAGEALCDSLSDQIDLFEDTCDSFVDAKESLDGFDQDTTSGSENLCSKECVCYSGCEGSTSLESFQDAVETLDDDDYRELCKGDDSVLSQFSVKDVDSTDTVKGLHSVEACRVDGQPENSVGAPDTNVDMDKRRRELVANSSVLKTTTHTRTSRLTGCGEYRTTSVLGDKAYLYGAPTSYRDTKLTRKTNFRSNDIVHDSVARTQAVGVNITDEERPVDSPVTTDKHGENVEIQKSEQVNEDPVSKAVDVGFDLSQEQGEVLKCHDLPASETNVSDLDNCDHSMRPQVLATSDQRRTSQYLRLTEVPALGNANVSHMPSPTEVTMTTQPSVSVSCESSSSEASSSSSTEIMSGSLPSNDVGTKIETAVTIRTERRRRRQIHRQVITSTNDLNTSCPKPESLDNAELCRGASQQDREAIYDNSESTTEISRHISSETHTIVAFNETKQTRTHFSETRDQTVDLRNVQTADFLAPTEPLETDRVTSAADSLEVNSLESVSPSTSAIGITPDSTSATIVDKTFTVTPTETLDKTDANTKQPECLESPVQVTVSVDEQFDQNKCHESTETDNEVTIQLAVDDRNIDRPTLTDEISDDQLPVTADGETKQEHPTSCSTGEDNQSISVTFELKASGVDNPQVSDTLGSRPLQEDKSDVENSGSSCGTEGAEAAAIPSKTPADEIVFISKDREALTASEMNDNVVLVRSEETALCNLNLDFTATKSADSDAEVKGGIENTSVDITSTGTMRDSKDPSVPYNNITTEDNCLQRVETVVSGEICEESNISVAAALNWEQSKLNETQTEKTRNFSKAEKYNRTSVRRATAAICTLNEPFMADRQSGDADKGATGANIAAKPRNSIRKSCSFRHDRELQEEKSRTEDNQQQNVEKDIRQFRKVSEICKTFIENTRSSILRKTSETAVKTAQSPVPQRKLMQWKNQNGKWTRVPVETSSSVTSSPMMSPSPDSAERTILDTGQQISSTTKTADSPTTETTDNNTQCTASISERLNDKVATSSSVDNAIIDTREKPTETKLEDNDGNRDATNDNATPGDTPRLSGVQKNEDKKASEETKAPARVAVAEERTENVEFMSDEMEMTINPLTPIATAAVSVVSSVTGDLMVSKPIVVMETKPVENKSKVPALSEGVSSGINIKDPTLKVRRDIKVKEDMASCSYFDDSDVPFIDGVQEDEAEPTKSVTDETIDSENTPPKEILQASREELHTLIMQGATEPQGVQSTDGVMTDSDSGHDADDELKLEAAMVIKPDEANEPDADTTLTLETAFIVKPEVASLVRDDVIVSAQKGGQTEDNTSAQSVDKTTEPVHVTLTETGSEETSEDGAITSVNQAARKDFLLGLRDQYRKKKPVLLLPVKSNRGKPSNTELINEHVNSPVVTATAVCEREQSTGADSEHQNHNEHLSLARKANKDSSADNNVGPSQSSPAKTSCKAVETDVNKSRGNELPRRIPKLKAVKIQEEIFEGKPEYTKECNKDPLGLGEAWTTAAHSPEKGSTSKVKSPQKSAQRKEELSITPTDRSVSEKAQSRIPHGVTKSISQSEGLVNSSVARQVPPRRLVKSKTLGHIRDLDKDADKVRFYIGGKADGTKPKAKRQGDNNTETTPSGNSENRQTIASPVKKQTAKKGQVSGGIRKGELPSVSPCQLSPEKRPGDGEARVTKATASGGDNSKKQEVKHSQGLLTTSGAASHVVPNNKEKTRSDGSLERQNIQQKNKLLSGIAEEGGGDASVGGSANKENDTGPNTAPCLLPDTDSKVKRATRRNKRRSLSLPTGSLVFGEARIVYKNGHFTIETMDGTAVDSTRQTDDRRSAPVDDCPDYQDADVDRMDVGQPTPDSGLTSSTGEGTHEKAPMRRQFGRSVLSETLSNSDGDVFEPSKDVQYNGTNGSFTLPRRNGIYYEDGGERSRVRGEMPARCHSSSSLPDAPTEEEVKLVSQRVKRTSSFRQAQEQGSFRLSGIEEDREHDSSHKRTSSEEGVQNFDPNKSVQSANNASFLQRMMTKRKSFQEKNLNLSGFSKQSESAKDFFSRKMSLKGLFKKNKSESLVSSSPLKLSKTPVSPPIAKFQTDVDIGSLDSVSSSPTSLDKTAQLRRRHTSADIFSQAFADAASAQGSNISLRSSVPEEDQVSITSSGSVTSSVTSSVHSVQSPPGEQPNKPKTPKPGASPRRNPLASLSRVNSQKDGIFTVDVVCDSCDLRTSKEEVTDDQCSFETGSVTSLGSRHRQVSSDMDTSDSVFVTRPAVVRTNSSEVLIGVEKLRKDSSGRMEVLEHTGRHRQISSSSGTEVFESPSKFRKDSSGRIDASDSSVKGSRKDSSSRVGYDKLTILTQMEMTGSNSNDSGIQHDVSVHSSNESLKGTPEAQVKLRRKKSLSPPQERPRSEVAVRWADLHPASLDVTATPVRLRVRDQNIKDRPRPKSDIEDNIQLFDELFIEVLGDFDSEGSSFLSGGMKAFGSEVNLQPYCSLRNLYEMRRQELDHNKSAQSRRMSTPHPIKTRLQRTPRKFPKQAPLVRCNSMPESLEKIHKRRKLHHLLDFHLDSMSRHVDMEDCMSSDSDLSFDHISLQEKAYSVQSSTSQLASMDEEDDNLTYAEALWDHITMDPEELGFRAGDLIDVIDMSDKDWWFGSIEDTEGWFPAAFVRLRVNQDHLEDDLDITLHEDLNTSPKLRRISTINKDQARANVVNEIINAEREYVKHLKDVVEGYIQHARKRGDMFTEERIILIFGNVEEIYRYSCKFLSQLEMCFDEDFPHCSEIGQCFLDNDKGFEIYSDYCNNHPSACEELKKLYHNTKYRHFFEACRLLQELIEIPLEGFLLTPVQKICKYPLQLAELLKYTPPDHPDYHQVENALLAMRKIAFLINERKRKMESIEKIAAWQQTVVDWEGEDLLERSSELIYSGEANKVNSAGWSQERYFFLFDHQLIYCKKELLKRHVFSYKGRIDLDHCEVHSIPDGKDTKYNVTVKNAWKLHETHKDKWYLLYAKTSALKDRWLKALQDERKRVKEDLENDFCVPEHWKQTVLTKVRSQSNVKDKHHGDRFDPTIPFIYQKDIYKDMPSHATLPRRLRASSQKQEKKKGWFIFGGGKKSKR